jgi:hypothetical protein
MRCVLILGNDVGPLRSGYEFVTHAANGLEVNRTRRVSRLNGLVAARLIMDSVTIYSHYHRQLVRHGRGTKRDNFGGKHLEVLLSSIHVSVFARQEDGQCGEEKDGRTQ